VAQLKAGIAMKAVVVRNGKEASIEARELVPGDIVAFPHTCEISYSCLNGRSSGHLGGRKHYSCRCKGAFPNE
jgi:hypothetical protein